MNYSLNHEGDRGREGDGGGGGDGERETERDGERERETERLSGRLSVHIIQRGPK